ncbi:pentatricopeptide repeat-containing protein At2g04860 [Eucalyptus grandis]|uniref:pentatricopeptide repeat-containing protein At2g04860 n=1 Tax=Eucalyptus grandis TaxID=71139 RepID=UPI00192EE210|nr:pentatricopeptide repeat-containing protein At2g04860 [Eucalyptus grandis]
MSSAFQLLIPSVQFFNSAIESYVGTSHSRWALVRFRQLLRLDLKPNDLTFSLLIKASASSRRPAGSASVNAKTELNQAHAHLVKSGFDRFLYLSTALLDLYMKMGCDAYARRVFECMPERDVVSWNALICGYSRKGMGVEALELFIRMLGEGFSPRAATLVSLVPSCGHRELLSQGRCIHSLGIKSGLDLDCHVRNALMSMYAKCGELDCTESLFNAMVDRSVVSWNTMISAYGQNGFFSDAMCVFKDMVEERCEVNSVSLVSLLSAHADLDSTHCYAIKTGLASDDCVVTSLLCAYTKHDDLGSGESLYERLIQKNLVSLTALLSSYAEKGNIQGMMKCFFEVQQLDMKLDAVALVSILHGLAHFSAHISIGLAFHCYGFKTGLCLHPLIANGLISMYFKFNNIEAASLLFSEMHEKPLISWNSVISGCVQAGMASKVIELFCEMRLSGHKPDAITIASLLCACSQLGYLQLGEKVHNYMLRNHLEFEDFVETALIDLYTKCGRIELAERVFKSIKEPCLASWNSIISGYSLCGLERKSLTYYSEMRRQGLMPDKITFLGVLAACTHGGLINEGRKYFDVMTKDLALRPTLQHHAFMVTLLGRAGLFEEALLFVKNMEVEPDSAVWGALLSACCIHGEVQLGECLAKKLWFLDQQSGGFYVLMSNLYASKGRWDDVARARGMMKDMGRDGCYGASVMEITSMEDNNRNLRFDDVRVNGSSWQHLSFLYSNA